MEDIGRANLIGLSVVGERSHGYGISEPRHVWSFDVLEMRLQEAIARGD
jgi:hypothetical protein